jgi:uncharacterized protein YbaA (DUF1428 family)
MADPRPLPTRVASPPTSPAVPRVCYAFRIIFNGTIMARYVDGFVLAVQKKKLAAYLRMAREGKRLWMKYGAIDYKECVADDVRPKGIVLTFPKLLRLKRGEVPVFSFIVYKSRAHRDQVTAKVMKDPSMASFTGAIPFDMKRMAMGGFKVAVDK